MKDEIVAGLKKLKPPSGDAPHEEVQAWRWFIAIIVGVLAVTQYLFIAAAVGFLTPVHSGFALASDVDQIRQERRSERETDLEAKILEQREKQCSLEQSPLRALYTANLQKLVIEYLKLTKQTYPLPQCDAF